MTRGPDLPLGWRVTDRTENPKLALHPDLPDRVLKRISERRAQLAETLSTLLKGCERFTLEIGCGHGHYLAGYAETRPDVVCIGIDLIADRVDRAQRKALRTGVARLHFLKAEAHETLAALPAWARMDQIFLLFPDPWPKKRHHKNRLLQDAFLETLADRCAPGARLWFRTDHEPYFKDGTATLAKHPRWRLESTDSCEAQWPFELATVFQEKAPAYQSALATRTG